MKWKIKGSKETATLSDDQLLNLLSVKVTKSLQSRVDGDSLIEKLMKLLSQNDTIQISSISEISLLSFWTGYYYRLLLERNDVELIEENNEPAETTSRNATDDNNSTTNNV